jgi:N-acetylglucosaminyl-diphospho-decaprenol L-rhamnosyltransferase
MLVPSSANNNLEARLESLQCRVRIADMAALDIATAIDGSPGIRMIASPEVSLSVVSHGHGTMIDRLLRDFEAISGASFEVIITINVPESRFGSLIRPFPIRIIENVSPKGFGANHNAAFAAAKGRYFAVINPDIRAQNLNLEPMLELFQRDAVGAVGPAVRSSRGTYDDSARRFPTTLSLLRRASLRQRELDYRLPLDAGQPFDVDWLAGMFIVFRREAFAAIGGFDERFYLYYEDVDICRRLHLRGWSIVLQPAAVVIHDAQRASHWHLRHMGWHAASMLRYLLRTYD